MDISLVGEVGLLISSSAAAGWLRRILNNKSKLLLNYLLSADFYQFWLLYVNFHYSTIGVAFSLSAPHISPVSDREAIHPASQAARDKKRKGQ